MTQIEKYTNKIFEDIKHIDKNGDEYWKARKLSKILEYSEYRKFIKVINKSITACKNSDQEMVEIGSGAKRKLDDYKLSRYACYLIVQNSDSRKKVVSLVQTYFAIQTRKQELTELEFSKLTEDEKRLYTRKNVRNKNKYLFETAKNCDVKNYGKFNNYGYKGLYNGEDAKDIAKRKGISDKEDILDYMGSTELAANLFRITQTDEVLKNKYRI